MKKSECAAQTLNPQPLMQAVKATVPWWSLPTCVAHVAMESQSFKDLTKALGQPRGAGGTGCTCKEIALRTLRFLDSFHLRILAHGAVPAQVLATHSKGCKGKLSNTGSSTPVHLIFCGNSEMCIHSSSGFSCLGFKF